MEQKYERQSILSAFAMSKKIDHEKQKGDVMKEVMIMTKREGRKICLSRKKTFEEINSQELREVGDFLIELRNDYGDPKVDKLINFLTREGRVMALEDLIYDDFRDGR